MTDIDGLKDIVNVTIDPAYNVKFIASQSFFNELDKMKDNDGRYLLQQDVTVASGYKLLGREVVVMADDVIGTAAGNKVAFVGDPSLFVKFFDRQQASVRWVDNDVYGQLLAGFVRFDVEVADTAAGFYVTLGPKHRPIRRNVKQNNDYACGGGIRNTVSDCLASWRNGQIG